MQVIYLLEANLRTFRERVEQAAVIAQERNLRLPKDNKARQYTEELLTQLNCL